MVIKLKTNGFRAMRKNIPDFTIGMSQFKKSWWGCFIPLPREHFVDGINKRQFLFGSEVGRTGTD